MIHDTGTGRLQHHEGNAFETIEANYSVAPGYEGKIISVEPHLKLKSWKGEPAHQRLHFCYDPEMRKIIIGYLGDHLDSAATRYAGQR